MKIFQKLNLLSALPLALACLLLVSPAEAGRHRPQIEADALQMGIPIDPVVHGDLLGLASQHKAIIAAASERAGQNPNLATLIAYSNENYAKAGYGFWPGSIDDEDHPFHVPVHAYLAADQAMLKMMEAMPTAESVALVLRSQLDAAIYASGFIPGSSICKVSFLAFNTAEALPPLNYMELLHYKPYQRLAFWAFMVLLAAASLGSPHLIMWRTRRLNTFHSQASA